MAHITNEDDNGIVVRGARMLATIGPFADELLVFPSTVLRGTPEDKPYSFAFAIPTDAKGLRFIAREPFDYGRSHFDHPLGSRFDESDAVVVFDDVHVPYERCFTLGDPEICNGFYTKTDAIAHMTHQVVARTTAKTEFILGLTTVLTEAIGIGGFQHVQADLAEIITTLETLRALNRAAEADAQPNDYQVITPAWPPLNAARNLYPRLYQRFPEILRKLGASGLMATPTEADVDGPAGPDIAAYLQGATLSGRDRVRLFRLVWDACASAFAGRQALYEYYFFGDPVRMATAYQASYDKEPYADAGQGLPRTRLLTISSPGTTAWPAPSSTRRSPSAPAAQDPKPPPASRTAAGSGPPTDARTASPAPPGTAKAPPRPPARAPRPPTGRTRPTTRAPPRP